MTFFKTAPIHLKKLNYNANSRRKEMLNPTHGIVVRLRRCTPAAIRQSVAPSPWVSQLSHGHLTCLPSVRRGLPSRKRVVVAEGVLLSCAHPVVVFLSLRLMLFRCSATFGFRLRSAGNFTTLVMRPYTCLEISGYSQLPEFHSLHPLHPTPCSYNSCRFSPDMVVMGGGNSLLPA